MRVKVDGSTKMKRSLSFDSLDPMAPEADAMAPEDRDITYSYKKSSSCSFEVIALFAVCGSFFLILLQNQRSFDMMASMDLRIQTMEFQQRYFLLANTDFPVKTVSILDPRPRVTPPPPPVEPHPILSLNCTTPIINAASYELGARVEVRASTETNITKIEYLKRDQSGYVIFDRDQLPVGKAFCSQNGKTPELVVQLAAMIKPFAVSYRHAKWDGDKISSDAPSKYDVMNCIDDKCLETSMLAFNCSYNPKTNGAEQICLITPKTPITMVRFRFHQNHGHPNGTCAYLVKVYGQLSLPEKQKRDPKKDDVFCEETAYEYYYKPFWYSLRSKSCSVLYSRKCCSACPECCHDCEINDFNGTTLCGLIAMFLIMAGFILFCWRAFRCGSKK